MDILCIFAIYIAVLVCVLLTIFTSVVLYEFLAAACDVVRDWVRELEWEWRCARMDGDDDAKAD